MLALVTGASSGIGAEIARVHAARGGDLALVARRAEALETLASELRAANGVSVHVFPADLEGEDAGARLFDAITAAGLQVDYLVNNAGFGGHGLHVERDWAAERAMVQLNVVALMQLTWAFGRQMAARGSGKVLLVGSTAGTMPGPLQAVYFATKAFVRSYGAALDEELRPRGVTVTVLAPGPVRTSFMDRADLRGTMLDSRGVAADRVARIGYEAMLKGRLHVVDDPLLGFATRWLLPFAPTRLAMRIARRMQSKP